MRHFILFFGQTTIEKVMKSHPVCDIVKLQQYKIVLRRQKEVRKNRNKKYIKGI